MKSCSSREVIKALKADGWYEVNCVGSHHQYKHPTKPGRYFYPAVFIYEDGQEIAVDFPDLGVATSGTSEDDALLSAAA